MVAKGQLQPDKSYVYTCGRCAGKGNDCPDCYGLDTARILEAMESGARGQRYYALLKAFLSVHGKEMHDYGAQLVEMNNGTFTPIDVGIVADKFGLNFKATCEWLEETLLIKPGTYRRLSEQPKIKVSEIIRLARERMVR